MVLDTLLIQDYVNLKFIIQKLEWMLCKLPQFLKQIQTKELVGPVELDLENVIDSILIQFIEVNF